MRGSPVLIGTSTSILGGGLAVDEVKRILAAIEKAVMLEVSELTRAPPNVIWVTEVSRCIRQSFYSRIYLRSLDFSAAYTILRGRLLHEVVLKNMPLGVTEVEGGTRGIIVEDDVGKVEIRGRADMVVGEYIVDLKTGERAPDKPPEEYRDQVQLYMELYGKSKGLIVYITREGLRYFQESRDEGRIAKLKEKALKLSRALRENKPPEPEVGFWCRWCSWSTQELCPEGYNYKVGRSS